MNQFSGPEIKWVDSGKELFRISFRLVSSIFPIDPSLQSFFYYADKMLDINHQEQKATSGHKNGQQTSSNETGGNCEMNMSSNLDAISYTSTVNSMSSFSLNRSISESSGENPVDNGGNNASSRGFSRFVQVQHGMPKILKSLIESGEISSVIRFFPVLMTQLLRLLVTTTSDDVSNHCIRVMIHVLHSMREVRKDEIALSYVEYFFTSESVTSNSGKLTLHEELIRSLVTLLKHSNGEFPLINNLIENSWFFLQLTSKSMANHLLTSGRIKMHRAERFSQEYMDSLLTFIDLFTPQIIEKNKELPYESKVANQNVSFFIRKSFSLMDRGFVFKMIKLYLDKFHSAKDSVTLHHYKFEFLALITAYEHHVPINLPLKIRKTSSVDDNKENDEDDSEQKTPTQQMSPTKASGSTPSRTPSKISLKMTQSFSGNKKRFSSFSSESDALMDDETILDEDFIRNHFTVGSLLQEVKSALSEVHQIRGMALTVLRNLLVKHSFDDRYASRSQQTRIASLYFPFLSVILDNVNRIQVSGCSGIMSSSVGVSGSSAAVSCSLYGSRKCSSGGSSCHAMVSKRVSFMDSSAGSSPTNTIDPHNNYQLESFAKSIATRRTSSALESSSASSSSSILSNKRDSSYLQMIAGTAVTGQATLDNSNFVSVSLEQIPSGCVTVTHNSSSSPLNSSDPEISSKSPSPDLASSSGVSSASDLSTHHHHPHFSHQTSTASLESQNRSNIFHQRSHSLPIRFDKLNSSEVRDMLIIFSWIVKHVSEDSLTTFLKRSPDQIILQYLSLHEMCLHEFKYSGKNSSKSHPPLQTVASASTLTSGLKSSHLMSHQESKSMTLPARITDPNITGDERTSELFSGLLEANLATEVGLVTLDVLGLLTKELSDRLTDSNGDNLLMKKMFSIYLSFLQLGQSENLLRHLFASLRCFVSKFPNVLFSGSPGYVGQLCFELLKCCSSRISSVRSESAALLYLLMRANFHFTQQTSMTRVHLQIIIAVSKLLGDATLVLLNNSRFQESLAIINNFASSDISMKTTKFPNEVRELTKKIRTVLMATAAMREHESDPEMLMDLQSSLANSYAETSPALRRTWLESMAKNHMKDNNFSEAAMCLAHVAALESGILRKRTQIQRSTGGSSSGDMIYSSDESSIKWRCPGPEDFDRISCNIPRDECNSGSKSCDMSSSFFSLGLQTSITSLSTTCPDSSSSEDQHDFSEDSLIETLESTATLFARSERFEMVPEVYKIMIPFHEKRRNFDSLTKIYKTVSATYDKIIQVQRMGKRIFGRFYRVAFYGREFFDEESGKEFVYKEPKVTSLPEISDRLKDIFGKKFGPENIRLIMSEKEVDEKSDCDAKYAYIQLTHVHPWNHSIQPNDRKTDFEKFDNHLNKFMFETPFSMSDPSKTHSSSCNDQCKRRTVLTTLYHFPYVVKRIPVISKSVQILSPIEVAIDEMESRVKELQDVINYSGRDSGNRPDLKKLQLKLQGSISVQVNAGPLAYARSFLPPNSKDSHGHFFPLIKINRLKDVFREFIDICEMGLELNEKFIGSDQHEYHQSMRSNLDEMIEELSQWLLTYDSPSNNSSPLHSSVSTDTLTGDSINRNNNRNNSDGQLVNGHENGH